MNYQRALCDLGGEWGRFGDFWGKTTEMRAFKAGLPTTLALAGLAIFVPQAGSARQTFEDVRPGARIRIFVPDFNSNYLRGTVVSVPDSVLTMRWSSGVLTIPLRDILRLDIRVRPRPVWKGTLAFGIGGTVTGLLMIPVIRNLCYVCRPLSSGKAALLVAGSAAIGAATGTLAAVLWNATRPWYAVTLPRNRLPTKAALVPLARIRF